MTQAEPQSVCPYELLAQYQAANQNLVATATELLERLEKLQLL